MPEQLKGLFEQSRLSSLFEVRVEEDNDDHAVIRLKSNGYRLRSFELWNKSG